MCQRIRASLALATAIAFLGIANPNPSLAVPQAYLFEGFAAGTVVAGMQPNGVMLANDPYVGFEFSVIGNGTSNSLCVFDSSHPTGGDLDLGTPNEGFGGPGKGNGGKPGMPGENKFSQSKVLIIPENMLDVNHDNRIDTPDDNHLGGQITIQWATPGIVLNMTFLDIEEIGSQVDFYSGQQLVQSFPIPALGDNSLVKITTVTNQAIDRTVITLPGSAALAGMTFDSSLSPTPLPVEATTWSAVKSLLAN